MNEMQILNIDGMEYYEKDGVAYLKLETVARGLGFTRTAESGNVVVRWERVEGYLRDLGVPTCGRDNFISEDVFYRLAMKAKNAATENFYIHMVKDVIPMIHNGSNQVENTKKRADIGPNTLQIFKHPEFGEVRVVDIDGEPWMVGKDVAAALGYSNTKDALSAHIDEEDKRVIQKSEITTFEIPNRGLTIINESGMYSLILSSKLPSAVQFKHWITSEVLPSIRKHGAYMTPDVLEQWIASPEFGIRLLTALKDEQDKRRHLESVNAQQKQLLAEYEPKASYYDIVLQTPDVVSINKIAKDYGHSAQWLNQLLHQKGIQYKQGNIWLLYQKHADQGYTKSRTGTYTDQNGREHSTMHTYWTQKGRLFIYELLKHDGILPLIDLENAS